MTALGVTYSLDYKRYLCQSQRKTISVAKKSNEPKRMKYRRGEHTNTGFCSNQITQGNFKKNTKPLKHVTSIEYKIKSYSWFSPTERY